MSDELFERYLRNDLDEAGARSLSALLETTEGAEAFRDFVQEWTLLGEAASQRVAEAGRLGTRKIRRRIPATTLSHAGIGWAAGIAAALLFMLGLALSTRTSPEPRPLVTKIVPPLISAPPPVPGPEPLPPESIPTPFPQVERTVPSPAPVPTPVPAPEPEKPVVPAPVAPPTPPSPGRPVEKPTRVALADVERLQGGGVLLTSEGRLPLKALQVLHADEGVETGPRPSLVVVKFPDTTRLELDGDTTIDAVSERKTVSLARGTLVATVAKQPAGKPFLFTTPLADATILGTQFLLAVSPDATRIEVREGRVKFARTSDGASIEVTAGHYAIASRGVKLESKLLVFTKDFRDVADTALTGAEPSKNFGGDTTIEVEGGEKETARVVALFQWDLSEIPPGALLRSAVISLYVSNETQSPGYSFFESKRAWVESEATWKVAAAGQPWKLPGARSPQDRGSEALANTAPRTKGEVSILLNHAGEALVQSWIRNPAANHGILLASDVTTDGFGFSTRRATQPERRPRLTLTYTLAAK